jgi:signal peptidase II
MKADYRRTVLLTVVSVMVLDQITKLVMLSTFAPGEVLEVIPGLFNLTLHFNPGVAFGLFAGLEPGIRAAVLIATTSVAISFVLFFMWTEYRDSFMGLVSLALVLGGALGNVIDRLRLGQVVDFFDFYIGTAHWPTFNVADSAICVGVGGLLLHGALEYRREKQSHKVTAVSEGGEVGLSEER